MKLLILLTLLLTSPGCTKNAQETTSEPIKSGSVELPKESASEPTPALVEELNATDDSIFRERIRAAKAGGFEKLPIGERIAAVGKLFLGTPYVGGTLDQDASKESLVINLRGLDCVTFYENALVIARILGLHSNPTLFDYREELKRLRYRGGALNGYASRLHYTIDYFRDGEKKRVWEIKTKDIGAAKATIDERKINFMSAHRALYKPLASDSMFEQIQKWEFDINRWGGFEYIPKADVSSIESKIQTGDIIGVTTSIDGLDCSHTGIAVRSEDGKLHFMHASSAKKEVIISAGTLSEYMAPSAKQTGIIIARPLEPQVSRLHRGAID